MTKKHFSYWMVFSLLAFLTACQNRYVLDTPIPSPLLNNTSVPSPTQIPVSQTTTVYPTVTPTELVIPQLTPVMETQEVLPTLYSTVVIKLMESRIKKEEGSIWIYLTDEAHYLVVDLKDGKSYTINPPPGDCSLFPLPETFQVICGFFKQPYLYHLLTDTKQILPIPKEGYIWIQPNLPNDIFYYVEQGTDLMTLYSYNLNNQKIDTLVSLNIRTFEIPPYLSTDRKYLVSVINNRLVKIDRETGALIPISAKALNATENVGWSPAAPQLVYGVTNMEFEIGQQANFIYLWDARNNQRQLLSTPPPPNRTYDEFGWPVWSPDGKNVAVISENVICILAVNKEEEKCGYLDEPDYPMNYKINSLAWSLTGNHIAFLEFPNAPVDPGQFT